MLGVVLLAIVVAFPLMSQRDPVARVLAFYSDHVHGPWFYGYLAHPVSTTIKLKGLHGTVTVVYDENGVPHIYASTEEDAFMALGWVQARDRFWQMDVMRRVGYGNLSALVGSAALSTDKLMRTLGYPEAVRKSYSLVKELAEKGVEWAKRALRALEAYTRGVNEWLKWALENNAIPIEYRLLGLKPEPWKPEDSIAVAYVIVHGLAFSRTDSLVASLAAANGGWIVSLYLDAKEWLKDATIIRGDEWRLYTDVARGLGFKPPVPIAYPNQSRVADNVYRLESLHKYLLAVARIPVTGFPLQASASNNWILSGKVTATGYPILANDPHLELSVPPVWYEFHIVAANTGLNSYGVGFPGVPFVIIGRNSHVAVGYTNSMIDVVDYYFYVWRDNTTYLYRGEWRKVETVSEVIPVYDLRGGYQYHTITIAKTVHGPLLEVKVGNETVRLAVRTTTTMPSTLLVWAYMVMHAHNVYDILRAQQYFYAPIQNAVAADDSGNILYSPTGLIPIRTNLPKVVVESPEGEKVIVNRGFLPFNGSRGEGEWIGFLPFTLIPRLLNPPEGFVATANNYITATHPAYLQFAVCDRYRFERIRSMIESFIASKGRLTIEDVMTIQTDYHSLAARNIITLVSKLLGSDLLPGWDYAMRSNDYRPTIAFEVAFKLHDTLWRRVFERAGLSPSYGCGGVRLELTEYILRKVVEGDPWYLRRLGVNDPSDLVSTVVEEAKKELAKLYGTSDETKWVWGVKHRYRIEHLLGSFFPWLNYRSYPAPGDPYTVNPSPETRIGEGVKHGPSVRFIADMRPGAEPAGYMQLPGGNIDNPFSPFFDNQLEGWVKGEYHEIWMYTNPSTLLRKVKPASIIVFKP